MYKVTWRRLHVTIVTVGKQNIPHAMSVCIALFIRNALRMCHIVIRGLSGCTIFATLSHKQHNFRKDYLNIKCVF
jgi:hypothetical protein